MTFATYLQRTRKKANLSQGDISKAMNYSTPQFLSNMERGLCYPPYDSTAKLAKILGVTDFSLRSEIVLCKAAKIRKEWLRK